jgi:hypothetical protein
MQHKSALYFVIISRAEPEDKWKGIKYKVGNAHKLSNYNIFSTTFDTLHFVKQSQEWGVILKIIH